MQNNLSITDLIDRTGSGLKKEKYAEATIATYEKIWRMFLAYARQNATSEYSTEFAYEFLRERFGSLDGLPRNNTQAEYFRGVCKLDEFFHNGIISSKRPRLKNYSYPIEYRDVILSFMKKRIDEGLSRSRSSCFSLYLERFAAYMHEIGVKNLNHLSAVHIKQFIEKRATLYTASTVSATISCLRSFLRTSMKSGKQKQTSVCFFQT